MTYMNVLVSGSFCRSLNTEYRYPMQKTGGGERKKKEKTMTEHNLVNRTQRLTFDKKDYHIKQTYSVEYISYSERSQKQQTKNYTCKPGKYIHSHGYRPRRPSVPQCILHYTHNLYPRHPVQLASSCLCCSNTPPAAVRGGE